VYRLESLQRLNIAFVVMEAMPVRRVIDVLHKAKLLGALVAKNFELEIIDLFH